MNIAVQLSDRGLKQFKRQNTALLTSYFIFEVILSTTFYITKILYIHTHMYVQCWLHLYDPFSLPPESVCVNDCGSSRKPHKLSSVGLWVTEPESKDL